MKKFLVLIMVLVLAVSMFAACGGSSEPAPAETDEVINVVYASYRNSSMPPQLGVQDAIKYINENSNLNIDYKGDAVLGGEADTMQLFLICQSVHPQKFIRILELIRDGFSRLDLMPGDRGDQIFFCQR